MSEDNDKRKKGLVVFLSLSHLINFSPQTKLSCALTLKSLLASDCDTFVNTIFQKGLQN